MKSIAEVIKARRTQKSMNGTPVPEELIRELLELSVWAPNHRLNHPWRFKVLTPSGIQKMLAEVKPGFSSEELEAFKGPMERVSKAGTVVFVSSLKDEKEVVDFENYAAVSCAIQNLMLEATARGLQSYWSTGKFFQHPSISKYIGATAGERFVAALWLGFGESPQVPPRKPASEFTTWFR